VSYPRYINIEQIFKMFTLEILTGWGKKNSPPRQVGIFFAILNILM